MKWFLFRWLAMLPFVLAIVWSGYNSRGGWFGFIVGISLIVYAAIWEAMRNAEIREEKRKQYRC